MNEKKFKEDFRKDVCFQCPKRVPCAYYESICELVTPCVVCEIRDECTSLCEQMEAYIQRGNTREKAIPFSRLKVPMPWMKEDQGDNLMSYLTEQYNKNTKESGTRGAIFSAKHIPWGAITEKAEKFLIEHFVNNLTYDQIAKKYNTANNVVYTAIHGDDGGPNRRPHKGALSILKEYAELRKQFIAVRHQLPSKIKKILHLKLFKFKTHAQIAEIIGISRVRVTQQIKTGIKMLQGAYKVHSGVR